LNIGPLWTPIFPTLGGLILESGSIGQHAAATAREYGIPAIVSVKHALQRIPDGAWVSLDGVAGTIELE
jgi:pyruvate,water dikinase